MKDWGLGRLGINEKSMVQDGDQSRVRKGQSSRGSEVASDAGAYEVVDG